MSYSIPFSTDTGLANQESDDDVLNGPSAGQLLNTVKTLSSFVSQSQIQAFRTHLSTVAQFYPSQQEQNEFCVIIERIACEAPQTLRDIFASGSEQLYPFLTITQLSQWVEKGIELKPLSLAACFDYLRLKSSTANKQLLAFQSGIPLADFSHSLSMYICALWGKSYSIKSIHNSRLIHQSPYFDNQLLNLPSPIDLTSYLTDDSQQNLLSKHCYLAMCNHLMAHRCYSQPLIDPGYSIWQKVCIELFEDSRVEWLSVQRYPGLKSYWQPFTEPAFTQQPFPTHVEAYQQFSQLQYALNNQHSDPTELGQLVETFYGELKTNPTMQTSIKCALQAANYFNRIESEPDETTLNRMKFIYRDDNRMLWLRSAPVAEKNYCSRTRREVNVMELANEIDCELADENADEIWTLTSPYHRYGDPDEITIDQIETDNLVKHNQRIVNLPEWDYHSEQLLPDWVTLYPTLAAPGPVLDIHKVIEEHHATVEQLKTLIAAYHNTRLQRENKNETGDELDINAVINYRIALRAEQSPDPRVYFRYHKNHQPFSSLLLMDTSASTAKKLNQHSVLNIQIQAASLLSWAMAQCQQPLAIRSFASNGRNHVQYNVIKEFNEPLNTAVLERLNNLKPDWSTRMGAALRYAGRELLSQPQAKKILFLISDGAPHDIDTDDPNYLIQDCKKAIQELKQVGIHCHCIALEQENDVTLAELFSSSGYTQLHDTEQLPEALTKIYASTF